MKKKDIIYSNLINLLIKLTTDDSDFGQYYESLPSDQQDSLLDISEQISNEVTAISEYESSLMLYPDFTRLISLLDQFKNHYDDYVHFRKNEIYAIITLIQKLTTEFSSEDLDLNEYIDTDIFKLVRLDGEINQDNFMCSDANEFASSLILINLTKKEKFKSFIDSLSSESHILYYLLSKIGVANSSLAEEKYVLVKSEYENKPKIVWATICLYIIKSGEMVHKSSVYTLPPSISPDCSIHLGKNYQQFADSINIISEYNNQKDILDKFLRIYHVLENFMYKSPLVNLERGASGQVFSIRDFKRMYDQIKDSELNMLCKLMEEISTLRYDSSSLFKVKNFNRWNELGTIYGLLPDKINALLKILNVKKNNSPDYVTFVSVNVDNLHKNLAKIIYAFRNSIVHNRETEFHLTHLTLNNHPGIGDTARTILENFILPVIEEIVFKLIISENEIVWYENSKLQLWDEN